VLVFFSFWLLPWHEAPRYEAARSRA